MFVVGLLSTSCGSEAGRSTGDAGRQDGGGTCIEPVASSSLTGGWESFQQHPQASNELEVTFSARAAGSEPNLLVGVGSGTATTFSDLAAIVRFNSFGTIDARNGNEYDGSAGVSYETGNWYRFRMALNNATRRYSVWVQSCGSSFYIPVVLEAEFRADSPTTPALDHVSAWSGGGSLQLAEVTWSAGRCVPFECSSLGPRACGLHADGCGGSIDCGACQQMDSGLRDSGAGFDAGLPLADAGSTMGECLLNGAIGYQETPGVKSPAASLTQLGSVTLSGETLSQVHITGSVRGHGTIRDSIIDGGGSTSVVQNNSHSLPIVLEDVTVGREGTYLGAIGVEGNVVMQRVRVTGYSDCLRNGPVVFENSWCSISYSGGDDHNDGYQAYRAPQMDVSIRCSLFQNLNGIPTAGLFHADGSQVRFVVENTRIEMDINPCIKFHEAGAYNELPPGDTVDDGSVLSMRNVECIRANTRGEAIIVDGLPISTWENVTANGTAVSNPN